MRESEKHNQENTVRRPELKLVQITLFQDEAFAPKHLK
jgi:hypothetical protein